ncbi:NfeD family protein [Nocardioides dubius]|uniref:NfeD family protein n=1 Tax=Nocardioides dubius TaxID=317019 RepID=A0ABP4EBJ6_9ACTN
MDWLQDNAWAAWLGAMILLGVAETLSLELVLIMLAAGAGVGMVAALLGAPLWAQAIAAAVTALAALLLVRPSVLSRLRSGPELTLGHDKLVGAQAVALTRISGHESGLIRLGGEEWTARAYDETTVIEAGQRVDVLQIHGATALVHPIPELD